MLIFGALLCRWFRCSFFQFSPGSLVWWSNFTSISQLGWNYLDTGRTMMDGSDSPFQIASSSIHIGPYALHCAWSLKSQAICRANLMTMIWKEKKTKHRKWKYSWVSRRLCARGAVWDVEMGLGGWPFQEKMRYGHVGHMGHVGVNAN